MEKWAQTPLIYNASQFSDLRLGRDDYGKVHDEIVETVHDAQPSQVSGNNTSVVPYFWKWM